METLDNKISEVISATSDDLSQGLLYTYTRINDNTKKILESTAFLYALIELLSKKGLLSIEELDERKRIVAERLVRKFTESGLGLIYQDPEYDKYTFEHSRTWTAVTGCNSAGRFVANCPSPCRGRM